MAREEQQPMSDARLAKVNQRVREATIDARCDDDPWALAYSNDVRSLFAEVSRLRAREAALVDVARRIGNVDDPWLPAEGSMGYRCRFCRHWSASGVPKDHTSDCAWKQARALLASNSADEAK